MLQTLQTVVGSTDPVLIDFAAGAVFPCQRPMTAHHGVFDLPQWRILPESWIANSQSKTWMATEDGGDILFDSFDEATGVLNLRMRGACAGCPSSSATLKAGVEQMMRHYVPEVTRVEQTL